MKIAITVCATPKYSYAMPSQARRVQAAVSGFDPGIIILVGGGGSKKDDPLEKIEQIYNDLLPQWSIKRFYLNGLEDGHQNYKKQAQLIIAQMRTYAFGQARAFNADYCWSLDSDVLPPENSLRCMIQSLQFDDGYYSIATCPYPSQGGGGFLGGRGTLRHPICPDFYIDERVVPKEISQNIEAYKKFLKEKRHVHELDFINKQIFDLEEKTKECPPKGNVWKVNAEFGWKPRGWLDNAYPAIGKGAILPSDWCGFGCTLMNRKALALAQFDGYDGGGTEDLYIVWHKWYQNELRINVITHCLADHVIRNPGKEGNYVLCQTYHETEGESKGHLRIRHRPWYNFEAGEKHNESNDGKLLPQRKDDSKK